MAVKLTDDQRTVMAVETIEAMEAKYEAWGETCADFADGERYLREEASDEELINEHKKWTSK